MRSPERSKLFLSDDKLAENVSPTTDIDLEPKVKSAREALDTWTREMIEWHFSPETGCPFWLDYAAKLGWDPRREIHSYSELGRLGSFQDEWLRGGPVRRWVPKVYAAKPIYVFETGGSTGVPKSRISIDDFRIDYEAFSDTLPDEAFAKGADWISIGPTGPRRLRLAVEELLDGVYFAPTYGNTLMGLAVHKPLARDNYAIIYYPPSPRAMIEVVDPDQPDRVVEYGETGRVRLTTLTREFFMPQFLERDEAEREPPCDLYPWDGVRNVRPFSGLKTTVVQGVY